MNMLLVTQLLYTMKMERRIDRAPFRPPSTSTSKERKGVQPQDPRLATQPHGTAPATAS